ncbi:MAG: NAD+ synthase [Verrucomicrobiota bacterium]
MKIGLLQINSTVGDFEGNAERILSGYREAVEQGADLVLTPEMAVAGYPTQDLIFRSGFVEGNLNALATLESAVGNVPLLAGFIDINESGTGKPFYNAAGLLARRRERKVFHKSLLPTYDVFDEARYFQPATRVEPVSLGSVSAGVTICEDVWTGAYLPAQLYQRDPIGDLEAAGVELILNLSASPFHTGKSGARLEMLGRLAKQLDAPLVYCNLVGGNDQLVFDGGSVVLGADGALLAQLPTFEEAIAVVDLGKTDEDGGLFVPANEEREIFNALVLGVRDYMKKCGFQTAAIGLSGGIDSALTAAVAAYAIGAENVYGVTMPSEFSSAGSVGDSAALARNLGLNFEEVAIGPVFESFKGQMNVLFRGCEEDVTEENIQARIRGMIMMSLSNKFGHLLLTTGNKSELAVGYCTIYGDMCGGLAVISDVPKTKVYAVARWLNRTREVIPWNTVEKPPSAELRPNQKDQDSLPEYDVLDGILELYVEESQSIEQIVDKGFEEEMVRWVCRQVNINEWKRYQAAPGIRVTSKAFGLGRRYPIAQRYRG